MKNSNVKTIDDYIGQFPADIQALLQAVRETIREAAPEATEKISYQIPTLVLNGNLVHFAAFKNHIGFFPTASGVEAFKTRLTMYKTSKGTIQFPFDKPLPLQLISEITRYRVKENQSKKKRR